MSLTPTDERTHPILSCARQVVEVVKDVAGIQPVFMTTGEKQAALVELARAEARLAELRLRVLAASDDVGEATGARDAAAWVSHATQADPQATRAEWHLAKSLERRELVAAGMRDGAVSVAQARVITRGLDDLPKELGPGLAVQAEDTLVGFCDRHRPAELRRLAARILDIVAPEIAEAELAKKLEAEENTAREKASLRFRRLGDGRTRISGVLPDAAAARLTGYLDAYGNPHRDHLNEQDAGPFGETAAGETGEFIPLHRRRAHALIALLEALDPSKLPEHGGEATTMVVTISLDQLRTDLATAGLLDPTGDSDQIDITATHARRLACTAKILPAILGGKGEVLDLGRAQRLFTKAQRRALRLRDQHCRAEGCTIPATWTEAHHLKPWSEGGRTDLNDAVSLCSHHHHRIHDHRYRTDRLANGDITFHRRT